MTLKNSKGAIKLQPLTTTRLQTHTTTRLQTHTTTRLQIHTTTRLQTHTTTRLQTHTTTRLQTHTTTRHSKGATQLQWRMIQYRFVRSEHETRANIRNLSANNLDKAAQIPQCLRYTLIALWGISTLYNPNNINPNDLESPQLRSLISCRCLRIILNTNITKRKINLYRLKTANPNIPTQRIEHYHPTKTPYKLCII
jgi:hypothetical protein